MYSEISSFLSSRYTLLIAKAGYPCKHELRQLYNAPNISLLQLYVLIIELKKGLSAPQCVFVESRAYLEASLPDASLPDRVSQDLKDQE